MACDTRRRLAPTACGPVAAALATRHDRAEHDGPVDGEARRSPSLPLDGRPCSVRSGSDDARLGETGLSASMVNSSFRGRPRSLVFLAVLRRDRRGSAGTVCKRLGSRLDDTSGAPAERPPGCPVGEHELGLLGHSAPGPFRPLGCRVPSPGLPALRPLACRACVPWLARIRGPPARFEFCPGPRLPHPRRTSRPTRPQVPHPVSRGCRLVDHQDVAGVDLGDHLARSPKQGHRASSARVREPAQVRESRARSW